MKRICLLAVCVVLALSIVSCNSQSQDPAVSPAQRFNIASGYDLEGERGSWVLVTDSFRLVLPDDLEQYELQVDQPDYDTLEFSYWYHTDVHGGESLPLFTLTAYEPGNGSPQDEDGWIEAGTDGQRRFAVRFAAEDGAGSPQEERYRELQTYFRGMLPEAGGEGALSFPG